MSTFNFKNWLKAEAVKKALEGDKDSVIEQKLRGKDDTSAPEQVTQEQLNDYRAGEPDAIFESQLEKVRKGASVELPEGRLNSSKSILHKHRNPNAYTGNINKLEELRVSKSDTPEKTSYDAASETAWKQRFWETKSPDGLKLASTKKKTVKLAQSWDMWDGHGGGIATEDEDYFPGGETEDLDEDVMNEIEGYSGDAKEVDVPDDILREMESEGLEDEDPDFDVMPASELDGSSGEDSTEGAVSGLTRMVLKVPEDRMNEFVSIDGIVDKTKLISKAVSFLLQNPEYAPPEVSSQIFSENLIDQGILMYILPDFQ